MNNNNMEIANNLYHNKLKKKLKIYYNVNEIDYYIKLIISSSDLAFYNKSILFNNLRMLINNEYPISENFRNLFLLGIYCRRVKTTFKLLNLALSYYLYDKLHIKIKQFTFPLDDINLFNTFIKNNNEIFDKKLLSKIIELSNLDNKIYIENILITDFDDEMFDMQVDEKTINEFIIIIKNIFEYIFDIELDFLYSMSL
jgi:hypothetical protein